MELLVCPYCGAVSTKSGLLIKLGTVSAESPELPSMSGSRDGLYHCPGCRQTLPVTQQEALLENLAGVIPSLPAAEKLAVAKILHHYAVTWDSGAAPLEEAIAAVAPKAGIIGRLAPRDRAEFLQYVAIILSVLALADDVIANYLVPSTVSLLKDHINQDDEKDDGQDGGRDGEKDGEKDGNRAGNKTGNKAGLGYGVGYAKSLSYAILPRSVVRFRGEETLYGSILWCLATPYGNNYTHPNIVASSTGHWTYNVDASRKNIQVWFFLSRIADEQIIRRLSVRDLKTSYFSTHKFTRYRIVHLPRDRIKVKLEVSWNASKASGLRT